MSMWNSDLKPMLLDEKDKPFDSDQYIYELKYDGMRCLIYVSPTSIKIINRHQKDVTNLFPELVTIKEIVKEKVIFDGEIICTKGSSPSFSKLQKRLHLKQKEKITSSSINNPATFICFDIIYQNKDLTDLPLIKRKTILKKYQDNDFFVKTTYTDSGIKLFKEIKKLKLEGIIAKLKTSKYYPDFRTDEWIKIKNYIQENFYIGGYFYTDSHVFSVVLGEYVNDDFIFVGKVFVPKKSNLFNALKKEKLCKSKFINFNESKVNYIKPKYICKVKYIERTENNNLRQPFYVKERL